MTGARDPLDYLHDILDAVAMIENFVAGMSFQEFVNDKKTGFAVVRALEVIGEAAKHVPNDVKLNSPDVPWRGMSGSRDRLIHAYFEVNWEAVWGVVRDDLPPLKASIGRLIAELGRTLE